MAAKFVTVEGLDGAGKTTHLAWLCTALEARGLSVCVTREPGGTPLGESLREMMLRPLYALHSETETLLMFAARREHIDKVIRPALNAGKWVLCDRFTDASFAYQACGSGVEWGKVETLERWVQDDLEPDLTLYFDVEPQIARSRMHAKSPDRFEKEQESFHAAVRAGYLRRARERPHRFRVIDASGGVSDIQVELGKHLDTLCTGSAQ